MAYSDEIVTGLAGLQNESPDYSSQVKGILLNVSLALIALTETACGATVKQFVNGNPLENIMKWANFKPLLLGTPEVGDVSAVVGVVAALEDAGADVTALSALVQQYPSGDGSVYSDQFKPILAEIASLLAGLGQ